MLIFAAAVLREKKKRKCEKEEEMRYMMVIKTGYNWCALFFICKHLLSKYFREHCKLSNEEEEAVSEHSKTALTW